jgi:hypothetical protein
MNAATHPATQAQAKPRRSPERDDWRAHQGLTTIIHRDEAGYRGCLGLALIINSVGADSYATSPTGPGGTELTFVPDRTVSWASMVDVPVGYFLNPAGKREVHWATVRPTTVRFGMPALAARTETHQSDFRAPDHYDVEYRTQLMRVFNALEWAMTTTAFAFRQSWRPKRNALAKALGYKFDPNQPLLKFGGGLYDGVARPHQWMPKAYIGFPEHLRDRVYDRATRLPGPQQATIAYSVGLREAFVNAMGQYLGYRAPFAGRVTSVRREVYCNIPVLTFTLDGDCGEHEVVRFFRETCRVRKVERTRFAPGDVIAEEGFNAALPEDWYDRCPAARWDRWTWKLVPHRMDAVMRLWFDRCGVRLVDGLVHFPTQMASVAAVSTAVDDELFWEISDCMEYHADDCDAIVFPTVQIRNWYDMKGWLPGDVAYDLTPNDARFESYHDQRERVAREKANAKAAEAAWLARQKEEAARRKLEEEAARLAAEQAADEPWVAKGLPDPRTMTPEQHEAAMKARIKDKLAKKPKK